MDLCVGACSTRVTSQKKPANPPTNNDNQNSLVDEIVKFFTVSDVNLIFRFCPNFIRFYIFVISERLALLT